MKKFLLIIVAFTGLSSQVQAQASRKPKQTVPITCQFQQLFTLEPALNKAEVLARVNKVVKITNENINQTYIKPAALKGDSILNEVYTYDIESISCFKGATPKLRLVFANNKLYEVYLSTKYELSQKQALRTNFYELRSLVKQSWPIEVQRKIQGSNTLGGGYTYFKVRGKNSYNNFCLLQYVEETTEADGKQMGAYLLELIWNNSNGTKMQLK